MLNLSEFYSRLGCKFEHHKHGNSPLHYSATVGHTVLEIYPLAKGQDFPDRFLRFGLSISNFESTIQVLKANQIKFHSEPTQTEFGIMAVVEDPDGRKIELYKERAIPDYR